MLRSRQGGVQGLEVPQERLKNEKVAPRALLQRSRKGQRRGCLCPKDPVLQGRAGERNMSCRGPAVRGTLPPAGSAISGNCPI